MSMIDLKAGTSNSFQRLVYKITRKKVPERHINWEKMLLLNNKYKGNLSQQFS